MFLSQENGESQPGPAKGEKREEKKEKEEDEEEAFDGAGAEDEEGEKEEEEEDFPGMKLAPLAWQATLTKLASGRVRREL
mmetsp:Transcript_68496/g.149623  ORF Transcript_68496/g.149623 Transcript_68496/m.149623 type:complete len:80 (+) Transcript_68496:1132-1371(+)